MLFELPVVGGGISIADALAEAIDSNKSGLLLEISQGDLRLVHFERMVDAATTGQSLLEEVDFEPVIDIEALSDLQYETVVRAAGGVFGFLGKGGGVAHLFSVSESFGLPYTSSSSGTRCQRPNKPHDRSPRDWYHYYPPKERDDADPNRCVFCGYWVP